MKYSCDITIDLPRPRVIELFDNPDNLPKWMEGLQSFEHVEGTPGEPGAISRLNFKMGKREFFMTETMISRNLPDEMTGRYDMDGTINHVTVRFEDLGNGKTKYTSISEFELKGFMMKIMGFLMPGMFKKQTMKYLVAFKNWAEGEGA